MAATASDADVGFDLNLAFQDQAYQVRVRLKGAEEMEPFMVGQVDSRAVRRPTWFNQSSLIYEDEYILLALISAFEVVVSFFFLQHGGHLFTSFIDSVIQQSGLVGLLAFKLVIVALVVFTCETLGYRKPALGRKVISIVNLLALVTLVVVTYEMVLLLIG